MSWLMLPIFLKLYRMLKHFQQKEAHFIEAEMICGAVSGDGALTMAPPEIDQS